MGSTSVHIKGSESVSKAAADAGGGIEKLKGKVKDFTKPLNDLTQAGRMLLTGGGLVMGLREVYKAAADCEAAFIKLNPDMALAYGSAAQFATASTGLKAALGGLIAEGMAPLRGWLADIFSEWTNNITAAQEYRRALDDIKSGTGTLNDQLTVARTRYDQLKKAMDDIKSGVGGAGSFGVAVDMKQLALDLEAARVELQKVVEQVRGETRGKSATAATAKAGQEAAKAEKAGEEVWEKFLDSLMSRHLTTMDEEIASGQALLRDNIIKTAEGLAAAEAEAAATMANQQAWIESSLEQSRANITSTIEEEPTPQQQNFDTGLDTGTSALLAFAQEIRSIATLIDIGGTVMDGFIKIIAPIADQILSPVIGALYTMGMTMAQLIVPVLNILAPVVQALAESFVWFYNLVILPVGNFIIDIFTTVGNIFVAFCNAISDLILIATFGTVNLGHMAATPLGSNHLQAITLEGLTTTGADYLSGGGGGGAGSSTTVQQVPDIYVYITVEGSVIGAGGPAEVGRQMVDAIAAYLGTGARVEFLQN